MKKAEVKEKLAQVLKCYVCTKKDILEDIPTLSTNDGVIAFCIEEGYDIICSSIEFCTEQGTEFNLDKEVEYAVSQLIQNYELVKTEIEVVEQILSKEVEEEKTSSNIKENKLEKFVKQQAFDNIRRIYSDLKINKCKGIKDNYNDLLLYSDILNRNKKYIPKKEYTKLKNILDERLNKLFLKNSLKYRLKNKRVKRRAG